MIDLRYFTQNEFRDSWAAMSTRLLVLLDSLRYQWGAGITISPVSGALARYNGPDDTSQHNVDRWGECRAADVFLDGMDSPSSANRAVEVAMRTGFTGVGIYPDWDPSPGVHVDVRQDHEPGDPALWGMLDSSKGQYMVSLEKALEAMR